MSVWRASRMENGCPLNSSPLVGEEGARAAQRRGKVRENQDGLTKRQLLPSTTVARSRELRKDMSEPERRLWQALRATFTDHRFRRQVPVGPYQADFCSHGARLIIEVDGDDHAANVKRDAARTCFLRKEGYDVIRFANADVMKAIDGVVDVIAAAIAYKKRDRS